MCATRISKQMLCTCIFEISCPQMLKKSTSMQSPSIYLDTKDGSEQYLEILCEGGLCDIELADT